MPHQASTSQRPPGSDHTPRGDLVIHPEIGDAKIEVRSLSLWYGGVQALDEVFPKSSYEPARMTWTES